MRAAPKLSEALRFPVVAGTALLAIGVTIAWWAKVDISPLLETAMIRRGELWRLVTSILPHGGVLHLVFNIYWLWVFGTLIEEEYGHLKTLALILLLALGSSAYEFAFASGGVGLSGVGYGLFGLVWVLSRYDPRFTEAIDRKTIELFVVWFFFCIIATISGLMPVANIAHGTGAVLGIATGFAITQADRRLPALAGITAMLAFGLWASTSGRPLVNLSGKAGYEEARWGFEALQDHRDKQAVRWLSDAVGYQPKMPELWDDLAIAEMNLKNTAAAMAAYRRAAELGEANAAYYLGAWYEAGDQGLPKDDQQALFWYRKAALVANNADAMNNVAWVYATSENPAIRDPVAALEYAQKATSLDKDHPDPNHLDTLAAAYYANGQYENAVTTEKMAIALSVHEAKPAFEINLKKYTASGEQAGTAGSREGGQPRPIVHMP